MWMVNYDMLKWSSSDDSLTKFLHKLTFPSRHYYFFHIFLNLPSNPFVVILRYFPKKLNYAFFKLTHMFGNVYFGPVWLDSHVIIPVIFFLTCITRKTLLRNLLNGTNYVESTWCWCRWWVRKYYSHIYNRIV